MELEAPRTAPATTAPAAREIVDLTACRALFALWVFAYHVNLHVQFAGALGWFRGIVTHGYLGVDGFFILSGLILARVDRGAGVATGNVLRFWGKRLARIYPVHFAVIVLLAALYLGGVAAGITPRDPARFATGALVANLALVQSWGVLHHLAWNYPSWSISTEWIGYLAFPFAMAGLMMMDVMIIITILPLCLFTLTFVAFLFHGLNLTYAWSLLRFVPEFAAGMATSALVPYLADELPTVWFAVAGAALAALFAASGHDAMTVFGLWLMLYGLAMHADAERRPLIGNIGPLHALGVISYAFYMSFAVAELVTAQLFRREHLSALAHGAQFAGVMTVITLALAIVLHVVIEKPFRTVFTRRLDPERAAALADGSVPL